MNELCMILSYIFINMRKTHRRGYSQEISTFYRSKEKDARDLIEIKQVHAVSSEHTRSTAVTSKPKDKHPRVKHKKQFSKISQPNWNPESIPYTPEEVLSLFPHLLQPNQLTEVKQYRNIYYLGEKSQGAESVPQTLSDQHFYRYKIGGHIAYRYEIIESINRGSFGEVLKVYDHKTKELLALKIVKKLPELIKQTFVEISILTSIKEKDKDDLSGIVRIKDFTIFRDHICIILELLDGNLYELIHANNFKGLHESFIRIFAIQILNSMNFLARMNVIHCDIKPQNVVLKAWGKSGVKLIDFGTSCYQQQQNYTYIQSRYYRAPQVIFQRYYTPAIDMWSFGVMMAELCLGMPLFPGHNDMQQILYMIFLLGYPDPEFSHHCRAEIDRIRENKYLTFDEKGRISEESKLKFLKDTGYPLEQECFKTLEERIPKDQIMFIHFLKQILKWDPKERITPAEALQHPWILTGLPEQIKELYTLYESLDTLQRKDDKKKEKKEKKRSKNKSKSREKSKGIKSNILNTTKILSTNQTIGLHKPSKSNVEEKNKIKSKKSKEKSKSLKKTGNKSPRRVEQK